jgi:hypothetical protein
VGAASAAGASASGWCAPDVLNDLPAHLPLNGYQRRCPPSGNVIPGAPQLPPSFQRWCFLEAKAPPPTSNPILGSMRHWVSTALESQR